MNCRKYAIGSSGDRNPLIIERLPEISYDRIGDSFGNDKFTSTFNSSIANLHFSEAHDGLAEIGFRTGDSPNTPGDERFAGMPSYGWTGYTDDYVVRGDVARGDRPADG